MLATEWEKYLYSFEKLVKIQADKYYYVTIIY